jgi:hypothetical protein
MGAPQRKSAVPALSMGSEPNLGPDFQQVQFSELVMDESVLGRLAGRARKVPFNTRMVVQADGSVGYWTGEGDGIGLSQMALTSTSITPLHVASIMVASDEFVRHASAEADTVMRRDLARGLALAIDQALLDPTNGGSEVKPASITNAVTPTETFLDLFEDFTGDLAKSVWVAQPAIWASLQTVVNPNIGLAGGEFQGAPAFASRSAPDASLVLIDPTGLTFALGELEYETSRYGTVQMVDVPAQISDGSPESPSDDPVASTVVSLYQANAVAIKLSQYINWSVRPGSVGMITFDSIGGSPL